jgi:hypothetical protein
MKAAFATRLFRNLWCLPTHEIILLGDARDRFLWRPALPSSASL